jgi:glycosyltransferase 2 family protein
MANKNFKSIIQFVVLFSVGILLIWLSLRQVAPVKNQIIDAFKNANYFWIIISMIISLFSHYLRAYRWNFLLQPLGFKTNTVNATCHVMIGYLANYGIPRMGEVSRCSLATKYDKVPFEVAFGTVITERIVDFILFLFIFLLTLVLQFNELIGLANEYVFNGLRKKLSGLTQQPFNLILLLFFITVTVVLFFLLRKKIISLLKGKLGGIIKGMLQGIGSIRNMESPLKFIFYFYSLYVAFFALNETSHLGQKECLILLLFGTFGVIFSPGGLGAYPFILGGILLNTFHVDQVTSFAFPWLAWTSQFILVLVFGLISLVALPILNRKKNVVS